MRGLQVQAGTIGVVINATIGGSNRIVAGVSSKKIVVISYTLIARGPVTATWKSDSVAISGPMDLVASSGIATSCLSGLLETAGGESLNLDLSAAIVIGGHLTYILENA